MSKILSQMKKYEDILHWQVLYKCRVCRTLLWLYWHKITWFEIFSQFYLLHMKVSSNWIYTGVQLIAEDSLLCITELLCSFRAPLVHIFLALANIFSFLKWKLLCLFMHMCAYIHTHMYVCAPKHVCVYIKNHHPMFGVFFTGSLYYVLRQNLSLGFGAQK